MTDDFDLEKLRLPPGEKWAVVPLKIQKRQRHFVKVPWTWVERLKNATGQTYRVERERRPDQARQRHAKNRRRAAAD
jgi:hypothetical protein